MEEPGAFLDRVAALGSSAPALRAFDRLIHAPAPIAEPAWGAALYRSLVEFLLRAYRVDASPGAEFWEWAPLFRLERDIDPHYFTARDISQRLAACPPLSAEVRAEWSEILSRYLTWRRQGLPPREGPSLLGAEESWRWIGLFPERLAWSSLEVLRRAGLHPLGSLAAWRAWRRFAHGEFMPTASASALREWIESNEGSARAGTPQAHRREFAAAAFSAEWSSLALEGPCRDLPDCGGCPLHPDCGWGGAARGEPPGAEENLALLRLGGADQLSSARLLQALFGLSSDQAARWHDEFERVPLRALATKSLPDLAQWMAERGLNSDPPGPERLQALFEFARRFGDERLIPGATFRSAEDVFKHFQMRLRDAKQEHFFLVLLDSRRRFQGEVAISQGTIERALVHPRDVFGAAVRERAGAVVIVHNHPSGDPMPSPEDLNVTKRLAESGALLGIPLLDHVVIGEGRYFSLAENGLLPKS